MICFDIETGPLADDKLRKFMPAFEPADHPGEFDPASVKLGNLKDEAKIAEKIAAAKSQHEQAVASHDETQAKAQADHFTNFVSRAALSPITGRILAIGYHSTDTSNRRLHGMGVSEYELIETFWDQYRKCRKSGRTMVGHNILGFDVPFLIRRSWVNDITVPETVLTKGKWLDDQVFVDTMRLWQCGNSRESFAKLDDLAKLFGIGGKPDGIGGGDFARLWFGTDAEQQQAIEYLDNDITMTVKVAQRLGLS